VSKGSKLIVGVSSLFFATAVWAGVPADKATIKIDALDGKKGAVEFAHTKHADEYKKQGDAKITCKDCHHTLKGDEPAGDEKVALCVSCHVKEGEAQKEHDGKKASFLGTKKGDKFDKKTVLLHANCVEGCHKAVKKESGKKITSCKVCHKK